MENLVVTPPSDYNHNVSIYDYWNRLIHPAKSISDDNRRLSRLLNQMMLIFIPLVLIIFHLLMFLPDTIGLIGSFTYNALLISIMTMCVIYIINRLGYYNIAVSVLYVFAFCIIVANAGASSAPHLEILYIVLLPLLAIVSLPLRKAILLSAISAGVFFLFQVIFSEDIPPDIRNDMTILVIIVHVLVMFVAYWRNKLEKERQELFLENEKSKLVQELVSNLSHDLKTPLTIINSSLYLLQRLDDPDKRRGHIQKAERQVWRLENYIQDMLAISRLEHDEKQCLEYVNLNRVVNDICTELRETITSKQLQLSLELNEQLQELFANADDLYRMVENLIENAINYTPDTGCIRIRTEMQANQIYLTVQDSGIGISEEDIPRIFERFYRADKARSTSTGGTGLGLPIVKRVIEMQGGKITVNSKPGRGSVFTITLPLKNKIARAMVLS